MRPQVTMENPCQLQSGPIRIFLQLLIIALVQGGRVTRISPSSGSIRGATRITIYGEGFAESQFNFYQPELGNNVTLISTSRTHALSCIVIPYYTTRTQIVCDTRPSLYGAGTYNIRVQVDGVLLSNQRGNTYCGGECIFKYQEYRTPTITSVSPRSGLPGSLLMIRGQIFSDQYIESEGAKEGTSILRIFAGSGLCDARNQETDELYGIALDTKTSKTGYIKCKSTTSEIASQRVSYIVSGYGRSLMAKDAILVDSKDRLYLFQSHADVLHVSPPTGSTAGGTILTITGKYFGKDTSFVSVGGVPCKILSATGDNITCQTREAPPSSLSPSDPYPGARGLLREVWTTTKASDLSSVTNLNSSAPDYNSEVIVDARSPLEPSFGESTSYSSSLRGFFIAPSHNNYTFYIQADDKAELFLSKNASASQKTRIASCPLPTTTWNKYPQQRSVVFSLRAEHVYYIEANHIQGVGKGHVAIGVKLEKTRYVNSQISSAVNEKQVIRLSSAQKPDRQIINVTSWDDGLVYEVQQLTVTANCSENTDSCGEAFRLSYGGHSTVLLFLNSTAENLQLALNTLKSVVTKGNVTVTQSVQNISSVYSVTFWFALPADTELLIVDSPVPNGAKVTVMLITRGTNGNWAFRFSLAGRSSDSIRVTATANDVMTTLQSMLSWKCNYQIPLGRAWYYNGFEARAQGPEWGERVVDERPYCGRVSLRNPTYIFRTGQSKDLGGRTLRGIEVSKYRQLCLAYKGAFNNFLSFYVSYTDKSGNGQKVWRKYMLTSVTSLKWQFHCTSIHDNIYSDVYFDSRANKEYGFYVDGITVARDAGKDIFIDDVFIWRDAVVVQRQLPAAEPNGHVIRSFSVQQLTPLAWAISLTPAHCGMDLDMIRITDAVLVSGNTSSDTATFRPANHTGVSRIVVSRDKKATPPIGGMFDVSFQGKRVVGISSDITADVLKSTLENNLDVGKVSVTRVGTCAGYNWTIEWATTGGDQPIIDVNGTGLTGNEVSITSETIDNGGMFLRPIPGDMLRVAESQTQATVKVNSIPSSCSTRRCSFAYSSTSTSTLISISPTTGISGTGLTLTGSGFSTSTQENTITIGGTPCHVITSTSTSITCTAGLSIGGLSVVVVKVSNKGFAQHTIKKVMFDYQVSISTISPVKGSIAGGTKVRIVGDGFAKSASQVSVSFGGSSCKILNTSVTEIQCITSKNSAGLIDIEIRVNNRSGIKSNGYKFDKLMSPLITSISPLTQSISGGDVMTITGTGFGSSGTVLIDTKPCKIINYFSTVITCSIPAHTPGVYDVIVDVISKGYASYNGAPPRIVYVLNVTDVFPRQGSVLGGTVVKISGRGFSNSAEKNVVSMGGVPCVVLSSRSDQILCKTGHSVATHVVDNTGNHPEYGTGYAWNPQTVTINAGDSIKWSWTSPYLTNLKYGIQQTADSASTTYDGNGFKSMRGPKGSFTTNFRVPGTYYYSSGPVDPYDVINMKGKIVVLGLKSRTTDIKIRVGDVLALHDTSHASPLYINATMCPDGITKGIPQCTVTRPMMMPSKSFSFVFLDCSTPEVTSLSPNIGASSTVLTIRGRGFGPDACQNEVGVGGQSCMVVTSSTDTITCRVTTGSALDAGKPHDISVRIKNRGNALVKISNSASRTFILQHTISSISPIAGSTAGGTILTVTGDGFPLSTANITIKIGSIGCEIQSSSYTKIKCRTKPSRSSEKLKVSVTIKTITSLCTSRLGCTFSFTDSLTPRIDYVTPTTLIGLDHVVTFYGSGFPSRTSDVTIKFGNKSCTVIVSSEYSIQCAVGALVAGSHDINIHFHPKGNAVFNKDASQTVASVALVSNIAPTEGSTQGGTQLTITGSGFDVRPERTTVRIGANDCIVSKVTFSEVTCVTLKHAAGSFEVDIAANGHIFPRLRYAFRTFITPIITSLSPSRGKGGDDLTISGSGLGTDITKITVTIGNSTCRLHTIIKEKLMCSLGQNPAGVNNVVVHVKRKGLAAYASSSAGKFTYDISIRSVSSRESGFGGGKLINVQGNGFDSNTIVKVCNSVCINNATSLTQVQCEVPAYTGLRTGDVQCPVSVTGADNVAMTKSGYFTYKSSLTAKISVVNPSRGGTGGGVNLTISGTGFSPLPGANKVTIAGVACIISSFSSTAIHCTTGQRQGSIKAKIRVEVGDNGIATQDNATFHYIDLWSSPFSWGYKSPPVKGDLVVIAKEQTMLLDITTPVFSALVINGELIFDEKDLVLNAEKILVVDGGKLQVGTEREPFQHKARIVLHGSARSVELPLFGAKVLAVREGTLDLHGKHVPITWTHLASTASKGATQLVLKQAVSWKVGDSIILASTSRSPRENEELKITSISGDSTTIGITPPLKYKHISIVQTIAGKVIEARAEVGLLTRNVVVEGSVQHEWANIIRTCPEDFDPDQFATQTCFQGRYGEEIGSDQYGSQIMLNAKEMNKGLVTGRISYIEVRNAGQAFRLGRYPIHFHMSGDVTGSYVRGCAVHHTFNRAVTIHGVHGLLVEHNVAYHVMGHAYFIEDGIETGNTIQYNLGVYVTSSSSLLNVDVTPGTFWITNPNNTVRHNAAAGGSHFGFWYNLPVHPGGPSFTPTVWPRTTPLGEFRNNSAHSFARYGVWIFPTYIPLQTPQSTINSPAPAKFYDFLAYNNLKGFEVTEGGAIQAINFTMLDNKEAGFEITIVKAPWGTENGGVIRDSLIVGYSAISGDDSSFCTQGGIVGPVTSRLTVSGVTFVNFDGPKCAALRGCSFCRPRQGGWTVKLEKTRLINAPNKAAFQWEHETTFEDLDGTLTGIPGGGSIIATNGNLPPKHCTQSSSASIGLVPGSICDSTPRFRRMAWNKPLPQSLLYKDVLLSNQYGTSRVPWASKRLTHPEGWMAIVVLGENYNLTFDHAQHITNISYKARFYEFGPKDYLWISHPMKQSPDTFRTTGKAVNMSSGIPQPGHASSGDWFFNNFTKQFTYIVNGDSQGGLVNRDIYLQVYRCYYKDCIKPIPPPPPEKRPLQHLKWSDPESWYGTEQGYGGYNKQLPTDGDDVMIKPGWWMVADTELPSMGKLLIYGTLELEPHMSFFLNATHIFVNPQGNLIIGWPGQPMSGHVVISLRGNWDTPDMPLQNGPNVGAKALGVFGNMEIHGKNRSVYWTRLERTAKAGSREIQLEHAVDWREGDMVVIAPTTYRPYETEVRTITAVSSNRKTLFLNSTLKYKHIGEKYTTGTWNYSLAAEVGLLTRSIVIEGADDVSGVLGKQSFGCRVLIGSIGGSGDGKKRRIRIENVEFRHCGQEGWTDFYDPRYSLAFLDIESLSSSSYVRGNSFHHGYNTGLGVFGVNGLLIQDNVIHHTVGSAIRVRGSKHQLIHNMAVLCVAPSTYKGRREAMNFLWSALFEINKAHDVTLRDNAAAGSERIGFHIRGESCHTADPSTRWRGNVVHSSVHGVHIGYSDGYPGCAKIANFVSWKNWDYGIFAYPSSRVMVMDSVVADNKVGILVNVFSPPSLSHIAADKFVQLDHVLIIGTSPSYDCTTDAATPTNAFNTVKSRGPRAKGGGNIGFLLSSFTSGQGMAPEFPWHQTFNYPAIEGITRFNSVRLAYFGMKCGKKSVAIVTNPGSADAMHPTEIRKLSISSVDQGSLVYFNAPNVNLVNPSDCVDMDCDGQKEVLIKDMDGSLIGAAGGSIISKAEYEWNGDPRRGLGDYRIPKPMLTAPDGTRLNASVVAPHHGIVRGTTSQNLCSWNSVWNAYKCYNIDYEMLIVESMDADTEVRRVSPVALSADGYTNLINGPQDHGWCFGYTCQERISTFYSIVATGRNYTLFFTGTNPENLRLRLLNSARSQVLRLAIWYSRPQRLDVYKKGLYIYPTNADLKGSGFTLKKKSPTLPDDQFEPSLSSISGANYFNREKQMLLVVIRGGEPVDIQTMPVIQVAIGAKPVHVNDFFETNLIANLAALLNIDTSHIRVVEIVGANGQSRRRRAIPNDGKMVIRVDISNPPAARMSYTPDKVFNENSTSGSSSTTSIPFTTTSPNPNMMSFSALQSLAKKVVEVAQTSEMSSALKLDVLSIEVVDPKPPRKDPTGGVRATNGTGGPSNGTWRYDQKIAWKEGNKSSPTHDYLIPARLIVTQNPRDANETVPFGVQPKLLMVDALNRTVNVLGHGAQSMWYVTAVIRRGKGDPAAILGGNTTIPFIQGWANFSNLHITHNSTAYILDFNITSPSTSNLNASSSEFQVKERILYFDLAASPRDSNETVAFGQQPVVEVRDAANGDLVTNTGWKGRKWVCSASLENSSFNQGHLNGSKAVEFSAGEARFTNLSIDHEGHGYLLGIMAFTVPSSRYSYRVSTNPFNVRERDLQLVIVQQPGNCNDTVICGSQPILDIQDIATNTPAGNVGWRGRIWTIQASMHGGAGNNVLNGTTRLVIPQSGRIQFTSIKFYDVATRYRLKFEVTTSPISATYSGMVTISEYFDVNQRQFYLKVITQPGSANASMVFGRQPVVEVRDVGTRARATPLKLPLLVVVSMGVNPKPGQSLLRGRSSVLVENERVKFTDLLITKYGVGYRLKFQFNYTSSVLSSPFEVRYVNDFSPEFIPNNPNNTKTLSEAVSIGTTVLSVSATDKDKGTQGDVYYSIHSGNIGSSFAINNRSGEITTVAKLDRETTASYSLVVRASDGAVAKKVRYTDTTVLVKVTDVNDNVPGFNQHTFNATVKETADLLHVIVRTKASDSDAGRNSEMRFSITSGNTDGHFAINSTSGDVMVMKSLDFESSGRPAISYKLGIYVTDLGTPKALHSNTTVTIHVTPVNEFTPRFTHALSRTITIKENLDVGEGHVLVDLNATDMDYGSQGVISYSIYSGNQEGNFNISSTSGVVTLMKPLDYELTRAYHLVIRATDGGGAGTARHANISLIVRVEDVNDNQPHFSSNMTKVNVLETLEVGMIVTVITAIDEDSTSNGRVSYSIATGNGDGYLRLNSATGEVTLLKSLDLETLRELNWNRTLVVIARDNGIPQLESNASFVFKLENVNEFDPYWLSKWNTSLSLMENIKTGTVIYKVTAKDGDYGPDGDIRYSMVSGNEERKFRLDDITGQLFVHAPLDREHTAHFQLQIQGSDSPKQPSNQRRINAYVYISVKDVNDNEPKFNRKSYYAVVMETAEIGSAIIWVHATDRDEGTNEQLTYSIESGNDHGFFAMDRLTGKIQVQRNLDLETQQHVDDLIYVLTVRATDKGTPTPLNNSVLVTIEIQSVNEFAPKLEQPTSIYIKIPDNTSVGGPVIVINATDADFGADGKLTYSIFTGNEDDTFAIVSSNGKIIIAKKLDYGTLPRFFLGINISDNAPSGQRRWVVAKVTVRLTNRFDNGGVDIDVRNLPKRLTTPGNLAEYVGVPTSSPITVVILRQGGPTEILLPNDPRLTIDDRNESRGLFSVVRSNDILLIQANNARMLGQGFLIVGVHNLYKVRIKVNVIGFQNLSVKALLHSSMNQPIKSLKRVGSIDGNFEMAELRLSMAFTDSTSLDVTNTNMASFSCVSNDVGVKVTIASSPKNLVIVDRTSKYGWVSLYGIFGTRRSAAIDVKISGEVVVTKSILRIDVPSLKNTTLIGIADKAFAQVVVSMKMNDNSLLTITNFTEYHGLVKFKTSTDAVVGVNDDGILILRGDSRGLESVTVINIKDRFDSVELKFYCNTEPPVGGIDLGNALGPAITNYNTPIDIRVTTGDNILLAYNITITYSHVMTVLKEIKGDVPYYTKPGSMSIMSVRSPKKENPMYITDVVFIPGDYSGPNPAPLLKVAPSVLINDKLESFPQPRLDNKECPHMDTLGDVTSDCVCDIYDAAYTMAYSLAYENQFASSFGKSLEYRTTEKMKQKMDFNLNGVIERADAFHLIRASLDQVRFVASLTVTLPDHKNATNKCGFSIITRLAYRNNKLVNGNNTQVYFEIASKNKVLSSQLRETRFDEGDVIRMYNGDHGLWGGIVKAQSKREGKFEIKITESMFKISDLGLSMIQVIHDSSRALPRVVTLFSDLNNPTFTAPVNVELAPNIRLIATAGHSPQLSLNVVESTPYCRDPVISKLIRIKFLADFKSVKGKEDIFIRALVQEFKSYYPKVTIAAVKLSAGSINVDFKASGRRSAVDPFLLSVWRSLQNGFSITVDGVIFKAVSEMSVDGENFIGPKTTAKESPFPVSMVVAICVAAVVIFVLIGAFVFYCKRKSTNMPEGRLSRWKRITKMNSLISRSTTSLDPNRGDTEMAYMGNSFPGHQRLDDEVSLDSTGERASPEHSNTSEIQPKRKLRKVDSASSRVSVDAWSETESPSILRKNFLGLRNGKVSPTLEKKNNSASTRLRLVTKQTSASKLIANDTGSESPSPSPPRSRGDRSPLTRSAASLKQPDSQGNLAKILLEEETPSRSLAFFKRSHRPASKERLTRQSSDSKLLENKDRSGSPLSKPVLHKKLTWGGRTSPRSLTPQNSASSLPGLPGSTDSTPPDSGSTTPTHNGRTLVPTFIAVGAHTNDITIEDEPFTIRVPVNVLNTAKETGNTGPFTKLGFIEAQTDSSLEQLRDSVTEKFHLNDKPFVFQDPQMMDIEPCRENSLHVSETFSVSVIIKLLHDQAEITRSFCPCGRVAQFRCSSCYRRGYCGRDCQLKDWDAHEQQCSHEPISVA